jgi:exodeoxyribonuclease VII small subunit
MTDAFQLETALDELESLLRQLESGQLSLDEALVVFERGQALIKRCQDDLSEKELRIQTLLGDNTLAPLSR